jgi:hypothetical protein
MKAAAKAQKPCVGMMARLVKDVTVSKGARFPPGTKFDKTWRFRNDSPFPWPVGTSLLFVARLKGDPMGAPFISPVRKLALPGEEVDVTVPMVAPRDPGKYVGFWRLQDNFGRRFGQRVKVSIKVVGPASSSSSSEDGSDPKTVECLERLSQMGFTDTAKNARMLKRHHGDLSVVVAKLLRKEQRQKQAKKDEDKPVKM